jgi:hypothetical protein
VLWLRSRVRVFSTLLLVISTLQDACMPCMCRTFSSSFFPQYKILFLASTIQLRSSQDTLVYALAVLGLLVALRHAYVLGYFVYRLIVRPQLSLTKYGSWAVVTGSTDGIGKAYAKEFAKKGLNVFLISRSADKLKEVKSEIGIMLIGSIE